MSEPLHPIVTLALPLGADFGFSLCLQGKITQARLRKIIAHIELLIDMYPEGVQP